MLHHCRCIRLQCPSTSDQQEFEAFLSALSPVLARLSYAFSQVVLVCEGSTGFQAQVSVCMKQECRV